MAKKRSRTDIIFDILTVIQNKGGEMKPTHLMYKANLSHTQMNLYLEDLVNNSAIKRIKKKHYDYLIITDRGFEFIKKIKEMQEFEKTFGF